MSDLVFGGLEVSGTDRCICEGNNVLPCLKVDAILVGFAQPVMGVHVGFERIVHVGDVDGPSAFVGGGCPCGGGALSPWLLSSATGVLGVHEPVSILQVSRGGGGWEHQVVYVSGTCWLPLLPCPPSHCQFWRRGP